jgi:PII-like signaling protein
MYLYFLIALGSALGGMNIPEESQLLRIFVGDSDRHHGKPLYEAIVLKAREVGLAGATEVRSVLGFGATIHLHTAKILRLSDDLPMIIEIIDSEAKIDSFLPFLNDLIDGGLATLEKVRVVHYRPGSNAPAAS